MTKKVAAVVVLVMVALLSVAGCTSSTTNTGTSPSASANATTNATTTAVVTTKSIVSASPLPTPIPTPTPTPTPTPSPRPLQCYHVLVIINCPRGPEGGVMCNNGFSLQGGLSARYASNPYFSAVITNNNGTNTVVGIVQETGQTKQFSWGDFASIEPWVDSVLTCK